MDKSSDRFEILPGPEALARHVAEWMTSAALAAKGPFRVSLSGGSTPKILYRLLTSYEFSGAATQFSDNSLQASLGALCPGRDSIRYLPIKVEKLLQLSDASVNTCDCDEEEEKQMAQTEQLEVVVLGSGT